MTGESTRRWVAQNDSARAATVALCRYGFGRRAFWVTLASAWLLQSALLTTIFDPDYGLVSRIWGGVVYAAIITAVVLVVVTVAGTFANWRRMRQRLAPGSTWDATATQECLTTSGPLGIRVSLPYSAVTTARLVGGWVLLRTKGAPQLVVYPRELIPDEALSRLMLRAQG